MKDILKSLSGSSADSLSKDLTDIILESKNAQSLPADIAKSFLGLYHDNRLSTPEGLRTLLEASIILDSEKTDKLLQKLNLNEAATKVRSK